MVTLNENLYQDKNGEISFTCIDPIPESPFCSSCQQKLKLKPKISCCGTAQSPLSTQQNGLNVLCSASERWPCLKIKTTTQAVCKEKGHDT